MSKIINIDNPKAFEEHCNSMEEKLAKLTEIKERNFKLKKAKEKSQSDNFAKINYLPEASDMWCKLFKENPFAVDVFYVLISKADFYGTTYIDVDGLLSVMNISETKKEYVPGYRINTRSITEALNTLIEFGFIKEGCVEEKHCYFLNSKYVIIRSLNNLKTCGYFPEEFIIEKSYKAYTWFAIDTHEKTLNKNMAIMRSSKEAFAFHLILSHFMDLGNKITDKLNKISELVGKSIRTLFDYFKFLFDNNLLLKKRANKGSARVNSYSLNTFFTYKINYADELMQAFGLDIYGLRGTTGCKKKAFNMRKNKRVNIRTQEEINALIIENEFQLFEDDKRKEYRDAYYTDHKIIKKSKNIKKTMAEDYTEEYCLENKTTTEKNTSNIPFVPSFSFDEDFGDISMNEANKAVDLLFCF
ncbi:MAG: hypothetical protein HFH60_03720 [Lachnospiraceae bacterium]|nr:hypothetical protein [Lachnospiraceae bacterium]